LCFGGIDLKLGVALGGGGMRGIAHAGVLKALDDNGIKIDMISGTSSGSLVASLYAMGYSPSYIYTLFKKYAKELVYINNAVIVNELRHFIFKKTIRTNGIKDGKGLEEVFDRLALKKGIKMISDIEMPLLIPAVDISKSKEYIFTSKEVRKDKYISDISVGKAVRSSSSFPAIFNPCKFKDHIFVDGGILDNVPVSQIKDFGADFVIAINFDGDTVDNNSNVMDIMLKSVDIMGNKIAEESLEKSDFVITIPTGDTGLFDINKIDYCYMSGFNTTMENISKIKEKLEI